MRSQPPTRAQARQLAALASAGRRGVTPTVFALRAWPGAEGHNRVTEPQPGQIIRGQHMAITAGGALGKLVKRAWAERLPRLDERDKNLYRITDYGRRMLRESQSANREEG